MGVDKIKEYIMYSLDLTTKNDLNNGFRKRHKDITEKDLMQAFKNCLNSLRKKAKAKKRQDKKRQWKYIVYAVTSNIHLSKGGKERKGSWHIHILIFGSPCCVIANAIKSYWTNHCYGLPKQQCLKACWDGKKLKYLDDQKSHCFLQSFNISPEELGLNKISRDNIRKLFIKYTPPDRKN